MSAQDLTEDEEAEAVDEDVVDDGAAEDEDDEAEVEDDENTELVSDGVSTTSSYNTRLILVFKWQFSVCVFGGRICTLLESVVEFSVEMIRRKLIDN